MDVHLPHPVQHLFPRPLPPRRAPSVDQVAHHHSPDPPFTLQLRPRVRPPLSHPLHPAVPLVDRSPGTRRKCLRRAFGLHLHRCHHTQALHRPRTRCPPPVGSG